MAPNTLNRFADRVLHEWLPTYCSDPGRDYDASNFKLDSIAVSEPDAIDCMLAIDERVMADRGGGRYWAPRSSAQEVLFWDGTRKIHPRSIWLWLEPVITFAGVGRLHWKFGWPTSKLGTQPPGWAFDVAAYKSESDGETDILGEVKKSLRELDQLRRDLLSLSEGIPEASVKANSLKKWKALIAQKPRVLWLLGPSGAEYVYLPSYDHNVATLHQASSAALAHRVA